MEMFLMYYLLTLITGSYGLECYTCTEVSDMKPNIVALPEVSTRSNLCRNTGNDFIKAGGSLVSCPERAGESCISVESNITVLIQINLSNKVLKQNYIYNGTISFKVYHRGCFFHSMLQLGTSCYNMADIDILAMLPESYRKIFHPHFLKNLKITKGVVCSCTKDGCNLYFGNEKNATLFSKKKDLRLLSVPKKSLNNGQFVKLWIENTAVKHKESDRRENELNSPLTIPPTDPFQKMTAEPAVSAGHSVTCSKINVSLFIELSLCFMYCILL